MAAHMQNPGVQAGASRNQLVGWLHSPYRIGLAGANACLPVSACRLGWREIWRGSALGRAVAMTERPFPDHRAAALALLNAMPETLSSRKAGQFLGQLALIRTPMSEAQADWLAKLLDRAGLPPIWQREARHEHLSRCTGAPEYRYVHCRCGCPCSQAGAAPAHGRGHNPRCWLAWPYCR
jgi:hypothetical protein